MEEMKMQTPRVRFGSLATGLVLIAVGGALLLDRLAWVDFGGLGGLWRYWPLIVIALGLAKLIDARSRRGRGSGLWLMGLGGWMLVSSLGLFGFGWHNSWPLLIILVGLSVVLRSVFEDREPLEVGHRD